MNEKLKRKLALEKTFLDVDAPTIQKRVLPTVVHTFIVVAEDDKENGDLNPQDVEGRKRSQATADFGTGYNHVGKRSKKVISDLDGQVTGEKSATKT